MADSDQEAEKKQSRMARTDLISALIVMAVGVFVTIRSLKMSNPTGWASAPGLVPLLFAASMIVMGFGLFLSAIHRRGIASLRSRLAEFSAKAFIQDIQTRRTIWIIVLSAIYTLVLTGRLPFEIASFLLPLHQVICSK